MAHGIEDEEDNDPRSRRSEIWRKQLIQSRVSGYISDMDKSFSSFAQGMKSQASHEYKNSIPRQRRRTCGGCYTPRYSCTIVQFLTDLKLLHGFDIVTKPPDAHIIGSRWACKKKNECNGNLLKCKSRWTPLGYQQKYGIKCSKTFASVAMNGRKSMGTLCSWCMGKKA